MNTTRTAFFEALDTSRAVLAAPETGAHWEEPSALAEYSVRGLAGHLVRATTTVLDYVAAPEAGGEPIAAGEYFAHARLSPDLMSAQHVAIRQRAEEMAQAGHQALLAQIDTARDHLVQVLESTPADRKLKVFGDRTMRLDDYLLTRIVELAIHTDDLAVSVGLAPPELPRLAADAVLRHLLDVARTRSGDLAVLRAFSRAERDQAHALRIF